MLPISMDLSRFSIVQRRDQVGPILFVDECKKTFFKFDFSIVQRRDHVLPISHCNSSSAGVDVSGDGKALQEIINLLLYYSKTN